MTWQDIVVWIIVALAGAFVLAKMGLAPRRKRPDVPVRRLVRRAKKKSRSGGMS